MWNIDSLRGDPLPGGRDRRRRRHLALHDRPLLVHRASRRSSSRAARSSGGPYAWHYGILFVLGAHIVALIFWDPWAVAREQPDPPVHPRGDRARLCRSSRSRAACSSCAASSSAGHSRDHHDGLGAPRARRPGRRSGSGSRSAIAGARSGTSTPPCPGSTRSSSSTRSRSTWSPLPAIVKLHAVLGFAARRPLPVHPPRPHRHRARSPTSGARTRSSCGTGGRAR